MRRKRSPWEIACIWGIPQVIVAVIIELFIAVRWCHEYSRHEFDLSSVDDWKMILIITGVFWMYVVLMNLNWIRTEKPIGMFTWMDKYRYEPPAVSSRKTAAQHPPIDEAYLSKKPSGLTLARWKNYYVNYPIRKGHALSAIILGTPGVGKSTLILTSLIYNQHLSAATDTPVYFIMDCKPELMRKSSFPEKNPGTDGKDVRPGMKELNITDRSKYGWDVYYNLDSCATDDEILTELDVIARALIEVPKGAERNQFFYESAQSIFCFLCLADYKSGRDFMGTINHILEADMGQIIKDLLERAEGRPDLIKVKRGLAGYANVDPKNEAFSGIQMAFRQSMAVFQKDSTQYFLSGNPRKLSPETLEEKHSMAFTIKTTEINEYKTILRLVVMQILHHCENRDEDNSHLITLVIDEAYRLGLIRWVDFLSVCRSKQVSCVLAFQSLSQMQSVWSKEDADSLLEMVSAIAVLSCRSKTTADMICSWAGTYQEEKYSATIGGRGDGTLSKSFEWKKVLEPADLMEIQKKKEVVLFLEGAYYRADVEKAKYYNIPELLRISEKCVEAHKQQNKEE